VLRQALCSHQRASPEDAHLAVSQGLSGLLCQPEFQDLDDLRRLIAQLEEAPHRLVPPPLASQGGIWIGQEHPLPALERCAVVQAGYQCRNPHNSCGGGGTFGQVALIGPMRMAYATARAAVSAVAGTLSKLLS